MDTISLNEITNKTQEIICMLCDGSHGNNYECEISRSDDQ